MTHPFVNIGINAARSAGKLMVRALDHLDHLTIEQKGLNDYVTQVDKACEQEIIDIILKAYPNHGIIGEESGELNNPKDADYTWIIDPLDGTTNYLHGFPQFCISIGIMHKGRIEHGIVLDPMRQELFTASRGRGAMLNETRIRVSKVHQLQRALIGTGFPTRDMAVVDKYCDIFKDLFPKTAGVRRAGAAALDLCYVACGRFDAFWEFGLKIWDVAAGSLIIHEAGGLVSGFGEDESFLNTGNIIASTPKIHAPLKNILHQHLD